MPSDVFNPDYVVPPGLVLEEHLEARALSVVEFSVRCGRSPDFIKKIISGDAPLDHDTALRFEKELGLAAYIWMKIEDRYQEKRLRHAEVQSANKKKRIA